MEASFASVLTDFTGNAFGRMYIASAVMIALAFAWFSFRRKLEAKQAPRR